jgi:arabinogalactan oligomer/maltooligosaccharide transport system permease protein
MKKSLIFFLTIFLMLLWIFRQPAVNAASNTLRVWVGAIEAEKTVMEEIAQEFTDETQIDVQVFQKVEIFTVPSALVNNAELEERPDLVYMQAPDIGSLVKSGYLVPLDIGSDLRERFLDVAFEAFSYNNQVYGIGYSNSASGLIYNKALLPTENLPKTWEELFRLADELTIINNGEIVQRGLYLNATDMWFNYPLIRHYGGYYYGTYPNGDYNAYDVGLDNEGMLAYVQKIKELKAKGLVLNNPSKKDYSEIVAEFAAGRVAMFFYGLWDARIYQNANIDYGIAPLPEDAKPITTVEGFVINKYTRNLPAAKAFLEFICRDDNQQKLIEAGNGGSLKTGTRNPLNRAVINSDYIQNDEILKSFSLIGNNVEPFPNIPEGTLWYSQEASVNTFRAIFFGDSSGNEVNAAYKLNELAEFIRRNVYQMNEDVEYLEIPWYLYLIVGLLVLAAFAYWFYKRRKHKKNREKLRFKTTILAWILLLPLLFLLGAFYLFPIFHNIYLSFTDYCGVNLRDYGLVGFANYRAIFTEGIRGLLSMTLWTVIFALAVIALSFLFGTLLATLLDATGTKIARVYRMLYIVPWVVPAVITLLMWQGLLETEGGLINKMLNLIGIGNIPWLTDPTVARISTIMVMVWFSFPYYMLVAFGYLKSIPKDYYEAAKVDGASKFYVFTRITLPLIFRALLPTLVMGFIMNFNQFGVYMLTQGGPASDTLGEPGATDLLITFVFNTAFNTKRYAVAASYSVIIFIFVAVFAIIAMRGNRKRTEA